VLEDDPDVVATPKGDLGVAGADRRVAKEHAGGDLLDLVKLHLGQIAGAGGAEDGQAQQEGTGGAHSTSPVDGGRGMEVNVGGKEEIRNGQSARVSGARGSMCDVPASASAANAVRRGTSATSAALRTPPRSPGRRHSPFPDPARNLPAVPPPEITA